MDMETEFEGFQKKNTPSLIGSSIRNSSTPSGDLDKDEPESIILDRARSSSRPVVKSNPSTSHLGFISVEDLKAEGGLINDEEGEVLDSILDDEGHFKEDALQFKERQHEEEEQVTHKSHLHHDLPVDPAEDKEHPEIFGGDAGKFLAPAAASSSDLSDFKYKSPAVETPAVEEKEPELIEPQKITTVDDILEKINQGSKDLASEDESTDVRLEEKNVKEPEVPDHSIDVDQEFTAPASMREGSNSKLLRDNPRSRSRAERHGESPFREGVGMFRPHLAKGESYHSGVSNDDYSVGSTDTEHLATERKPRHDPGSVRISNSSSLNYLRSISRSRSRVANDRDAIGKDRGMDQEELKQGGVLMHDGDFSQMADLEDAISNALNIVENTKSVKDGSKFGRQKENILSDLHSSVSPHDLDQVKEEDEDRDVLKEKTNQIQPVAKEVKADEGHPVDEESVEIPLVENTETSPETEIVSASKKSTVDEDQIQLTKKDIDTESVSGEHEEESKEPVKEEAPVEEPEEESEEAPEEQKEEEPAEAEETKESENDDSESSEEPESEPKSAVPTSEKEVVSDSEGASEEPVSAASPVGKLSAQTKELNLKSTEESDDDIDELLKAAEKEQSAKAAPQAGSVYVPRETKMAFEDEPVYIYTSLAGGFQIATRTNRLQTILTANRVKFGFKDLGTDEQAKKIWKRYSGGKTLPARYPTKNAATHGSPTAGFRTVDMIPGPGQIPASPQPTPKRRFPKMNGFGVSLLKLREKSFERNGFFWSSGCCGARSFQMMMFGTMVKSGIMSKEGSNFSGVRMDRNPSTLDGCTIPATNKPSPNTNPALKYVNAWTTVRRVLSVEFLILRARTGRTTLLDTQHNRTRTKSGYDLLKDAAAASTVL
ncbi:hypothetical protein OGAPHI_005686 [Ogataea philodendri]|uniref:Uncharacterized protein n=1 Tax=Ogataea philodendri TaxID=1378263 RepID=A0A9P8T1S3_9ASCO|nr:uncharacterized protein OGAPHI_005686 [Ogataea philodendri]KAH3662434.1 hypothetical protein OGAPHI_005686 [Ogataea philodendri]